MKKFAFFLMLCVLVTTGQGCLGGGSAQDQLEQVTLDYWRVFDGKDDFEEIIDAYHALHPNVTINYRRLRFEEYEDELIRALAEGRGPDVFTIHNTWMNEYQDLILPMPDTVNISYLESRGTLRKETVVVETENRTLTEAQLRSQFVEQIENDVVLNNPTGGTSIYGLPLSFDTLALFYNRDLLDAAGFPNPPKTWDEFQSMIPNLTSYSEDGTILQSGAALGTSDNVERVTDILSLLMMQVGTSMTDTRGQITFDNPDADDFYPALNALEFYTDFANPTKEAYTWNDSFGNSFDEFAGGNTAFFLGYSYHIPLLRTTAPRLNFAVTGVPQLAGDVQQINFANYWVETVADSTEAPDWAWDFLLFAAGEDNVGSYLTAARKPTALRNLISTQLDDEELAVFSEQSLTAESWYHGSDATAAEDALKELIDTILLGTTEPKDALARAASKVQQTY